ncbi:MAG: M56 family metallopeptidase [Marinilabiliaceae bacterium]|nr:M56 family metallopeptidase [Marinilabiliaceae bacterium]
MSSLINYLFESAVVLGVLIIFYWLVLHKESFFRFNRIYLLVSLLLAAFVPFLRIPIPVSSMESMGQSSNVLATITIYAETARNNVVPLVEQIPGFKWIYLVGVIGLLIRLIVGIIRVGALSEKASLIGYKGYNIADLPGQFSPFSFFKVIFMNRSLYSERDMEQILLHEMAHVRFKHSWDVLLLEVLLIVQWFNPFAWLLRNQLKELHEFQADHEVLLSGTSIGQYKELLFFQSTGARLLPVNNLNQSLTQKRFKMMTNNSIKRYAFLKIGVALVLVSGLTFAFAGETTTRDLSITNVIIDQSLDQQEEKIYDTVDVLPQYVGGETKMFEFIRSNLKYPDPAKKAGKKGKVFVSFVINQQGKVTNTKIARSSGHKELDEAAIDVVELMPAWTPGKHEGKVVNVRFVLPLNFALN